MARPDHASRGAPRRWSSSPQRCYAFITAPRAWHRDTVTRAAVLLQQPSSLQASAVAEVAGGLN